MVYHLLYDLINNNFNGQFGRSDYINEDVFVEFQFNNFIIDLRKDFVTINTKIKLSFEE